MMNTWVQDHIQKNRLSYSLVIFILIVTIGIAILSSIVKFYLGYQKEIKKIDEVMLLIHESYTEPMNISLWSFDYNQMKVQAQGILNLPYINKVEVEDQFGGQGQEVLSLGEITDKAFVKQTFPMEFNNHGTMKHIGTLSVYAGLDQIRREIKYNIVSGFIIAVGEILILAVCILLIIRGMIMGHLGKICRYLANAYGKNRSRSLILDRRPDKKPDILDEIVGHINKIIERNLANEARLDTLEQELAGDRDALGLCKERLQCLENSKIDEAAVWDILRDNETPESLAGNLISYFCRHTGAGAGLFYGVDEKKGKIRALAGYAVPLETEAPIEFEIGQGQLGQAVLNKQPCDISSPAAPPYTIQSTLGGAEPEHILMYPFTKKGRVFCALEMGRFLPFDSEKTRLLDLVCERVAGAMETAMLRECNKP